MRRTSTVAARVAAATRVGAMRPVVLPTSQHHEFHGARRDFSMVPKISASQTIQGFYTSMMLGQRRFASSKPIAPGDPIPDITIDHGFNPIGQVNMAERTKGKKTVIVGLPGAFTPC